MMAVETRPEVIKMAPAIRVLQARKAEFPKHLAFLGQKDKKHQVLANLHA
jgi:UDP-N-acetylglucosamine 2-epimerase